MDEFYKTWEIKVIQPSKHQNFEIFSKHSISLKSVSFLFPVDELGEYLKTKGADDTITNADGLTCYEGLTIDDVTAI